MHSVTRRQYHFLHTSATECHTFSWAAEASQRLVRSFPSRPVLWPDVKTNVAYWHGFHSPDVASSATLHQPAVTPFMQLPVCVWYDRNFMLFSRTIIPIIVIIIIIILINIVAVIAIAIVNVTVMCWCSLSLSLSLPMLLSLSLSLFLPLSLSHFVVLFSVWSESQSSADDARCKTAGCAQHDFLGTCHPTARVSW